MVDENYHKLLKRIAKSTSLSEEEIDKRVEAKRSKLAGLISKEGAAQVIAAELGISFDNEKLKIDELTPGMRKVNTIGKIINLFPVRTFTTKKGDESKVANLVIADETSNIKVVLWDTNHIELIEKKQIAGGSVIEIMNATMRDNEIHLGSFSELKISKEIIKSVKTEKVVQEKNISNFRIGDSATVRAFIVQSFEPKFFNVCSACKKKVNPEGDSFVCAEHGKVATEKRALITLVLDDGTETIRAVLFHENLPKLGITELENINLMIQQKEDLLGKEMIFSGNVRMNKFFNNSEFFIDNVNEVDVDKLLKGLENK